MPYFRRRQLISCDYTTFSAGQECKLQFIRAPKTLVSYHIILPPPNPSFFAPTHVCAPTRAL